MQPKNGMKNIGVTKITKETRGTYLNVTSTHLNICEIKRILRKFVTE
jgi:hypothetical protein